MGRMAAERAFLLLLPAGRLLSLHPAVPFPPRVHPHTPAAQIHAPFLSPCSLPSPTNRPALRRPILILVLNSCLSLSPIEMETDGAEDDQKDKMRQKNVGEPMADGDDKNVLSFETAMAQFGAMFPQLSADQIESVLRKHEGNVADTIDELLLVGGESGQAQQRQQIASCSNAGTTANIVVAGESALRPGNKTGRMGGGQRDQEEQLPPTKGTNRDDPRARPSSAATGSGGTSRPRDPCADDEKIALLIQNREFLRYLRHDPHFQRALLGQQHQHHHHHHQQQQHNPRHHHGHPTVLATSRAVRSPNTGRLFDRTRERTTQRVPDGPKVDTADNRQQPRQREQPTIPEGPLIDYVDAEDRDRGWAGRLRAKLAKRAPEGSEQLPPCPVVDYSDEQLRKGIQGVLARGGKGLLEGLAKKFSNAAGGGKGCWHNGGRVRLKDEMERPEAGDIR